METVLRAMVVYYIVFLLIRVTGRRAVSEMTQFDFVLLLILGDATQQALLGNDHSIVNSIICVATLITVDVLMSYAKLRFPRFDRWMEGLPILLVQDGRKHQQAMRNERVTDEEILEQARDSHGLERMDQVKHAVLEKSGHISIVPRESDPSDAPGRRAMK